MTNLLQRLSIEQLIQLRLLAFENAESLHKEARLLFEHGFFARAYFLAHCAIEELGKLQIVIGIITALESKRPIDWDTVRRSFCDHEQKIEANDGYRYLFALLSDTAPPNSKSTSSARKKQRNAAAYVDAVEPGEVYTPMRISRDEAQRMIDEASESLHVHSLSVHFPLGS